MKSFLNTIAAFFESIGRARAATYYSRMGDYAAARKVMQD
jgi:hypothetical protein